MKLCDQCGNEVAASADRCPYCGYSQLKSGAKSSKKLCTFLIKRDLPTCADATRLLESKVVECRKNGVKVLKLIHGYGSSGAGGELRWCLREFLEVLMLRGWVRSYITGEDFGRQTPAGRTLLGSYPWLAKDEDCGRRNKGVTLVVL